MGVLKKKNYIKIPKEVEVYYNFNNCSLFIKNSTSKITLRIGVHLTYLVDNSDSQMWLYVTSFSSVTKNHSVKTQKKLQGLAVSYIKNTLLKMSNKVCVKLKLVGVGYKASVTREFGDALLCLKLGYSHSIYFKLPSNIDIKVIKSNKLFIFGDSIEKVSAMAAFIRSHKAPEPYKGKGILYVNEKIELKIGKKV